MSYALEILSRLFEALVTGMAVYVVRLSGRVRDLEEFQNEQTVQRQAEEKLAKERQAFAEERAELSEARSVQVNKGLEALVNMSTLLVKVETLLETALKRLDIVERHMFKL